MKSYIILPFLFFFLVLTMPAMAYLPVEINETTGTPYVYSTRGLACTNSSGTFYCYVLACDNSNYIRVFRYDDNLTNVEKCYIGLTSASGCGSITGFGIANSTHSLIKFTTGKFRLVPLNNFTGEICTAGAELGSTTSANMLTSGGYYSGNDNVVYWGGIDDAKFSDNSTTAVAKFWADYYVNLRLDNQSDNSTIYAMTNATQNYTFGLYTDGALTNSYSSISELYGTSATYTNWDLYKLDADTTYLYFAYGTYPNIYLVRANFSEALLYESGTEFIATSPEDNAIVYTIPDLSVRLTTDVNGTIFWYLDGSLLGSVIITTNGTMTTQPFSANSGTLSTGSHTWYARFVDQFSNTWTTETLAFTYTLDSSLYTLMTNPADGLALLIGGLFNVETLEGARLVAGTLLSFIGAIGSVILISILAKGKLHASELSMMFGLSIIVFIVMFTFAGWLPYWLTALLVVIGGFAFAKMSGLGGG